MRISKMPKFDSQNPAQTPSVVTKSPGWIVAVKYVQCVPGCPYECEICKSPVNDSGARKIL